VVPAAAHKPAAERTDEIHMSQNQPNQLHGQLVQRRILQQRARGGGFGALGLVLVMVFAQGLTFSFPLVHSLESTPSKTGFLANFSVKI
jgi:hypothetical protein